MLTYKAMFKYLDDGVHAEVLDFPGVITWAADVEQARRMLSSALVDMSETFMLAGDPLPRPDAAVTDPESDWEEPIYLLVSAASRVSVVVDGVG